ncbi:hypothetical protein ACFQHW_01125 [Lapidilactobacillus achengensis]|uniref:Uncharacterized protein n=1 Tax=Lapidilactobacillus achengensis TaxID=2486000 RepID=A0ABW1UJS0_9LACO|nr:hypothetical protein [Lapidilactobacillus achengensis]
MLRSNAGRLSLWIEPRSPSRLLVKIEPICNRGGDAIGSVHLCGWNSVGVVLSLIPSGKAAKNNSTAEPHGPTRLLGRIELICNRGEGFDEVLLQASAQTIARFCGGTAIPTDVDYLVGIFR